MIFVSWPPGKGNIFFFDDQAVSGFPLHFLAAEDSVDTFLAGFNSFNLGTNFSAGAARFFVVVYIYIPVGYIIYDGIPFFLVISVESFHHP